MKMIMRENKGRDLPARHLVRVLSVLLMVIVIGCAMAGTTFAAASLTPKTLTMAVGTKKKLTLKGTTVKSVWSSSAPAVASVSKGTVTAKKAGNAVITAKAGSVRLTCRVTVENPRLSHSSIRLAAGRTIDMKVKNLKTTPKITWKSSNTAVAAVTKKGKVTASLTTKKAGSATISATLLGKTFSCKLVVENPVISAKTLTLTAGSSSTLKVNNLKSRQTITWKSSNSAVASVSGGKVTAKKAGTATITATVMKKNLTCKVTVKSKTPSVTYETRSYSYGGDVMLTVKVPKGWKFEVSGITAGNTAPIITVTHPTNSSVQMIYIMKSDAVKSVKSHNWWAYMYGSYSAYARLTYLIPAAGYAANGIDTAGLFMGIVQSNSSMSNGKILKKLGTTALYGDTLLTALTMNGKKVNGLFNGFVSNDGSYTRYYNGEYVDVAPVTVYNVSLLSAPAGSLSSWVKILGEVQGSINLTQALVDKFADESNSATTSAVEFYRQNSTRSEQMVNKYLSTLH